MRTLRSSRRQSVETGRTRAARRLSTLLLSGLLFVAGPPRSTLAQSAPVVQPHPAHPFAAFIAEASQRFGIPEAWIRAVMHAESAGDVRAISRAGAMGLMQIMPNTWAELRARHRLGSDPYEARDNILAGAAYLREMHDRYGSPGFLAAYNAGPGRYDEYLARGRALPAETRAYVAALAPLVGGGEIAGSVTVAAADPLAWTRAPLFIARIEGPPSADLVRTQGPPDDAPAAAPEREPRSITPQSSGLFVARSDGGAPR
ncbi:lytic transglycosylase domain-containing protein [Sinorhizobium meliloti]|jgi:soluble lytic murein transglycosylase-like protein|uniref:lytic transglycosylase domain-containing protein n=1 Tax=Rhizobium meliloti TaxID=382 RepID=UPI000A92F978|nr:lytic transglycosylase domain-containing protein [Sinorhizobium meliloti]RVO59183.1 lytic transglycosylase domain-containing protein [Sinorhizobium meliloti]HXH25222.1 lytic transglycosylase domain-containing protein [Vicinamibacterales bacterium]